MKNFFKFLSGIYGVIYYPLALLWLCGYVVLDQPDCIEYVDSCAEVIGEGSVLDFITGSPSFPLNEHSENY